MHPIEWRKGRRSMESADCVELAVISGEEIGVRDSKSPEATLTFGASEWKSFLSLIKDDRFSNLI